MSAIGYIARIQADGPVNVDEIVSEIRRVVAKEAGERE
jgi:hypothetical protein